MKKILNVVLLSVVINIPELCAKIYCGGQDTTSSNRYTYHTIDLFNDLTLPLSWFPDIDQDIDLRIEQTIWDISNDTTQTSHPLYGMFDEDHLELFLTNIWRGPEDNDIRTIWNYYAVDSLMGVEEYGDSSYVEWSPRRHTPVTRGGLRERPLQTERAPFVTHSAFQLYKRSQDIGSIASYTDTRRSHP